MIFHSPARIIGHAKTYMKLDRNLSICISKMWHGCRVCVRVFVTRFKCVEHIFFYLVYLYECMYLDIECEHCMQINNIEEKQMVTRNRIYINCNFPSNPRHVQVHTQYPWMMIDVFAFHICVRNIYFDWISISLRNQCAICWNITCAIDNAIHNWCGGKRKKPSMVMSCNLIGSWR